MFSLKLLAKGCISCGICMDICDTKAIAMRTTWPKSPEGKVLTYRLLHSGDQEELSPVPMMTFPYLAHPELCNGCAICVDQCPVNSLVLESRIFAPNQESQVFRANFPS
jgi:NAD-dependent dihydropyrimidine dehydrogenase PreA subunit